MSGASIFAFVPSYRGQISGLTFDTSHALGSTLLAKGIGIGFGRYSWYDIAELRNIVLSIWFDKLTQYSHILFLDDDIGFAPQLVLDMLAFGEPVVGGLYRQRCERVEWAASGLPPGEAEFRWDAFLEVEGLGAGCLLIRRDAIEQMLEKHAGLIRNHVLIDDFRISGATRTLGFFDQIMTPDGKMSEDLAFCRRWRDVGGKVWANIAHDITHVGPQEFKGCYALWRTQQMAQRSSAPIDSSAKVDV